VIKIILHTLHTIWSQWQRLHGVTLTGRVGRCYGIGTMTAVPAATAGQRNPSTWIKMHHHGSRRQLWKTERERECKTSNTKLKVNTEHNIQHGYDTNQLN